MVENIWGKITNLNRTFIIAEAGVNHNGNLETAKKLVDAAVTAGVDAVKFQTFNTERLVVSNAPKADYQLQCTDESESQYHMLHRLELSYEAHHELFDYCRRKEIFFMSSAFDEESSDFLEDLGVSVLKIPSGEITNLPCLAHMAQKGIPMIVSTGMASLGEVEAAIDTIEKTGNRNIVLLHCVSSYPAEVHEINLKSMQTMARAFGVPTGYSDHTAGIEVPVAAVALGACVIEKHFTLDRRLPGPDHQASLEPAELSAMVRSIRSVEKALGNGRKKPVRSEENTAMAARKSLVAACDMSAGTTLTKESIVAKRPGNGLPPALLPFLIGCTVGRAVPAGTLLTWEMLR